MSKHVAVWLDHAEAKIFHVDDERFDPKKIEPHHHARRVNDERSDPAALRHYFDDIARALNDAEEILVVGPGSAKLEFIKHVHEHARALVPRIVGVETTRHPTDGELEAHARHYFHAADRMRGTVR